MIESVTEGLAELVGEAVGPAPAVLDDESTAIALAALAEEGRRLDENARARRTWASYQADWAHFTDWCTGVDLDPLPAAPSTVALYLTEAARSFKVSTLRRRLAAISVVHQGYGHPSPTTDAIVRTRMKGIARDKADETVTRKAPAWGRDVRRMVADLADDPRGTRDPGPAHHRFRRRLPPLRARRPRRRRRQRDHRRPRRPHPALQDRPGRHRAHHRHPLRLTPHLLPGPRAPRLATDQPRPIRAAVPAHPRPRHPRRAPRRPIRHADREGRSGAHRP